MEEIQCQNCRGYRMSWAGGECGEEYLECEDCGYEQGPEDHLYEDD